MLVKLRWIQERAIVQMKKMRRRAGLEGGEVWTDS